MACSLTKRNKVVLKSLEEEVKCPVCLDIFTDPKRLPCEHVFCAQCLKVLSRRTKGTFDCPVCRTHTPLQDSDVDQFPTAYQVNRLIEMYQATLKEKSTIAAPTRPQANTCDLHLSQSLALYCDTCKSSVCRNCVINSCSKNGHSYSFLKDLTKTCRAELEEEVRPIKMLHQHITTALLAIPTADKKLEGEKLKQVERVEATFDTLCSVLQQEKRYLTAALEDQFQEQTASNASKKKELSEVTAELAKLIRSTDVVSSKESLAVTREEMIKKKRDIRHFKSRFTQPSLCPEQLPELKVKLLSPADLERFCQEKNCAYQMDYLESHFDRSAQFQSMKLGEPFQVCLYLKFSAKITSKLVCVTDNTSQSVQVTRMSLEAFMLHVVPLKRGRHELHVKHNGTHLCSSPISSYVLFDPRQIATLVKPIKRSLDYPCGVKCHQDKVYVAEVGKRNILQCSSKNLSVLKKIAVASTSEMMIHQDFIYCNEFAENRVLKMDMNGEIIVSTGARPRLFNFPNGIRLSKQNEIYVCDTCNHRIQVFDTNLTLVRVIGERGSGPDQFASPDDLDFDEDGNAYVVEQDNHRIQVLTPQGKHVRFIGTYGTGPGELNNPISAAIHQDFIFITDSRNRRISVFTLAGDFVTTFGQELLVKPERIAINKDGYIFISNNYCEVVRY